MLDEKILTLEEVSEHLRVPENVLQQEIRSGRLRALNIGGHIRIPESQLAAYKAESCGVVDAQPKPDPIKMGAVKLGPAKDFDHRWPDDTREHFTEAQEGVANTGGEQYHVKLGFTLRNAAGASRRRGLVLVDRYPTVEFVAADRRPSGKMASIIKDRQGKQLPLGASVPPEYANMPVGAYRDVVNGSGASNGLAVICDARDFETMVKHALIRYKFREDRA